MQCPSFPRALRPLIVCSLLIVGFLIVGCDSGGSGSGGDPNESPPSNGDIDQTEVDELGDKATVDVDASSGAEGSSYKAGAGGGVVTVTFFYETNGDEPCPSADSSPVTPPATVTLDPPQPKCKDGSRKGLIVTYLTLGESSSESGSVELTVRNESGAEVASASSSSDEVAVEGGDVPDGATGAGTEDDATFDWVGTWKAENPTLAFEITEQSFSVVSSESGTCQTEFYTVVERSGNTITIGQDVEEGQSIAPNRESTTFQLDAEVSDGTLTLSPSDAPNADPINATALDGDPVEFVGCNVQDAEVAIENRFGAFRFEGNQDFNPNPKDYDLYYDIDEEGTSLHTCKKDGDGNWKLIVERTNVQSLRVNSEGSLVRTAKIAKAEGELYDQTNEGKQTQIRYTTIKNDFVEWTVTDNTEQQDLIGNKDDAKLVDEIPQTASECGEKLKFNVDDAALQELETGKSRIVESGGTDLTTDDVDTYVNGKSKSVDLHVCDADNNHYKDTKKRHHLRINESGNLVTTEKVTDVDPNGGVHGEEDLGKFTTTEILNESSNSVEWKLLRFPSNSEGNVEKANSLSEIPTSDQECENREAFHQ